MQVNKRNFKKVNMFASYVNAAFNHGVFVNPNLDQCWEKRLIFINKEKMRIILTEQGQVLRKSMAIE